jgi:ABC-type transport system substrate-binding protein
MNDAPYNRMPVGTGPFKVTEWVSGDHITMVKNTLYREADKIKIDKLFFKIIPSREVGIAQLQAVDIDGVWDLIEAQIRKRRRSFSKNIPTVANGGTGYNYTRHRDALLDKYLDMAGKAPSMISFPMPWVPLSLPPVLA